MRRIVYVLLVVLATAGQVPTADPAQAAGTGSYVFTGGGWGHAVGMSQYGAWGMADDGFTFQEILTHYYTGVTTGDLADAYAASHLLGEDDPLIWVGLLENESSFTFEVPAGAAGGVELCQAGDGTGACPKPDAVPAAGETWSLSSEVGSGGEELCRFERVAPAPLSTPAAAGDCSASITFGEPGLAQIIEVDGTEYAHGTVRVRQGAAQASTWTFHVSLEIHLEDYLLGLGEMPSSWPDAALQAQAVAGRTYAAYKVASNYDGAAADPITAARKSTCYCHIRSTPVDQNYVGYSKESEPVYGVNWIGAVQSTAGVVATSGGVPIQAYYGSSTGGATENSEDVWSAALSYARSVDDPWSVGDHNPLASWDHTFTAAELAGLLGFESVDAVTLLNPAPAATMQVTGTKAGAIVTENLAIGPRYSSMGLLSPSVHAIAFVPDGGGSAPAFDDIANSVHIADINRIAELRITLGCNPPDNNLFCPLGSVTRGQMAAFINRALNLPATTEDFFTDDETSIFEADINELAAAGVGLGCTATQFCPNDAITREEMAAFLVRSMGLTATGDKTFVDISGSPYEAEILILGDNRITIGCNPPANDRFCPTDRVSRQQMASFIVRSIDAAAR